MTQSLQNQDEYISKEQFRKECHVSKATALKLIQSGLLPAIDTHNPTRRYLIARKDVETYLIERERNPAKFGYNTRRKAIRYNYYIKYSRRGASKLRQTAKQLWVDKPDMLSINEIAELLGYNRSTIRVWQKTCGIPYVRTQHGIYFSKQHLIDFIASPKFYAVKLKSPEHIDLLRRAHYA